MKEEIQLEPSEKLAYWTGVVQSDGSFVEYKERGRKKFRHDISLAVSKKSLPMLLEFKKITKKLLNRKSGIWKIKKRNIWAMHVRVNNLLQLFKDSNINFGDPPVPPSWTVDNQKLFGAYLAGLIDGDGDVNIKRPKYPQLLIRITSGKSQKILAEFIEQMLNCSTNIYKREADKILENRKIHGKWFELHFLVSSKNIDFIKNFVLPHITIKHKKGKLQSYIQSFGVVV